MVSNASLVHPLSWNKNISNNGTVEYVLLSTGAKTFTIAIHLLIFVVGIIGNSAVIYHFGIKRKPSRAFDINIISLAVADLVSSFFSPVVTIHDLVTDLQHWHLLGEFGCKVFVSLDHVTMLVSAAMLTIMSLNRLR